MIYVICEHGLYYTENPVMSEYGPKSWIQNKNNATKYTSDEISIVLGEIKKQAIKAEAERYV